MVVSKLLFGNLLHNWKSRLSLNFKNSEFSSVTKKARLNLSAICFPSLASSFSARFSSTMSSSKRLCNDSTSRECNQQKTKPSRANREKDTNKNERIKAGSSQLHYFLIPLPSLLVYVDNASEQDEIKTKEKLRSFVQQIICLHKVPACSRLLEQSAAPYQCINLGTFK